MREYQVQSIHDVSFLKQKLRQAFKTLYSSNFGEVFASFWSSHDIFKGALKKELDQVCMILTYIFIQDEHLGIFSKNVCEHCCVQLILKFIVFAQEEKELEILLAGFYIVLKDDDIAQSVKTAAKNPQSLIYIKVFFIVFVKDLEYRPSDIDLFEVRRNIISQCQRAKRVFFLKYLQKMRGQDYLIMTKANKQRTDLLNYGDVIEIAFLFGHKLLAKHCNVIDDVVLNHVKHVSLKSQTVAVSDQLKRFGRVDLDCFALSSEQVLQHSDLLKIFVSLEGRTDETCYDIKLQIAILYLIENQKIFVEVNQLFVFCLLNKVVNFIQIFAFKCSFDEQDIRCPYVFVRALKCQVLFCNRFHPLMLKQLCSCCSFFRRFFKASQEEIYALRRGILRKRRMLVFNDSNQSRKRTKLSIWRISCDQLDNCASQRPDITFCTYQILTVSCFRRHPIRSSSS